MNPPKSREEELFFTALALPLAGRSAYLASACGDDDALRGRVELLLRAHEDARNFMETSPAAAVAETPTRHTLQPEEKPGETIGRYKLLQKIGEGGCGVVYMAEQQEPVVRLVALKVIKLGMDTKEVIARFEAERQALALMDHPNIARVFDGGATDAGRPFFVMELVRGVPITKFCDEQNLPTAKRLELFTQVCHAVQHAHQKGIIHRDLKPSNILVTAPEWHGRPARDPEKNMGETPMPLGIPKVIDFGIAKATHGRLTDNTLFTAFEQFIGTPAYMSPEQAEMSGLDIDTRSDIYSLGVLLYELLTGRPPFDPKTLVSAGLDEIRRIIREVEPPRPSTRLSTLTDADQSTIAKQRGLAPTQLSTLLRGDLDWIVMRCLEKERTRRYETADQIAQDLCRHLGNEPVSARPPTLTYRLEKLLVRNRSKLGIATATTIACGLLAGMGWMGWQRRVAVSNTPEARLANAQRNAQEQQASAARELGRPVEETNSIGMVFRIIPAGTFEMGSAEADVKLLEGRDWFFTEWAVRRIAAEFPQHRVRITRPFAIGMHEVTVGQFRQFVTDTGYRTEAERSPHGGFGWTDSGWQQQVDFDWHNPGFGQSDVHPVGNVAWQDAQEFCRWLSKRENHSYRLPTEAEWEFACRAGTPTAFCNGDSDQGLRTVSNVADQALQSLHPQFEWARKWNDGFPHTAPVGKFAANAYGLHDMHGNVWEWCSDYYDPTFYARSPEVDPACNDRQTPYHVFRGGGWDNYPGFCRSADRYSSHSPTVRTTWAGFRVVLEVSPVKGR